MNFATIEKATDVTSADGLLETANQQAPIVGDALAADKSYRTLQAGFALAGHELVRIDPTDPRTGFYATRWGMVRHLPDLNAARAFLAKIGGAA
jgi:hypothetical protein